MLKITKCFVLCLGLVYISHAQPLTNGGFETWAGGNPAGWFTSNIFGFDTTVTQSTNAHSDLYAAEGTVRWFFFSTISPMIAAGEDGLGFPINFRPAAVRGWYTFASDSGDMLNIVIGFQKNGAGMGFAVFSTGVPQAIYKEFVANTTFISADIPDTITFSATVVNSPRTHVGTSFKLDDLVYGPATDVSDDGNGIPGTFALEQNYPNPFNPATRIQFEVGKEELVTLKVYNLLGAEVATLVNGHLSPGRYRAELDATNLPSGMYFYRLQAGEHSAQRKMTLLK